MTIEDYGDVRYEEGIEKGREEERKNTEAERARADAAEERSAYASLATIYLTEGTATTITVDAQQSQPDWQTDPAPTITQGQKGIELLPAKTKVKAMFSQEGAKRKFDKKYRKHPNVSSRLVKPGNQAVDNQIKAQVGQLLKMENQDITIVSHDKGFNEFAGRKKRKHEGTRILVVKSVKDRLSKN